MVQPSHLSWTLLIVACCGTACVKLNPTILDHKTQLENQVLGSFQRLERDLVLASSVRGDRAQPLSPLQREALEAMMTREFQRDDIEQAKREGRVGEATSALLVSLDAPKEEPARRAFERLIRRENSARTVLIRRVIQLNRELSDRDLPLVRRIFYRLNVKAARPGDRVQRENGSWEQLPKPAEASR